MASAPGSALVAREAQLAVCVARQFRALVGRLETGGYVRRSTRINDHEALCLRLLKPHPSAIGDDGRRDADVGLGGGGDDAGLDDDEEQGLTAAPTEDSALLAELPLLSQALLLIEEAKAGGLLTTALAKKLSLPTRKMSGPVQESEALGRRERRGPGEGAGARRPASAREVATVPSRRLPLRPRHRRAALSCPGWSCGGTLLRIPMWRSWRSCRIKRSPCCQRRSPVRRRSRPRQCTR